jgi:hypothetical protein
MALSSRIADDVGPHSALIPAALMIGHHFSMSAFLRCAERLRRLVLPDRNFQTEFREPLADRWVSKRNGVEPDVCPAMKLVGKPNAGNRPVLAGLPAHPSTTLRPGDRVPRG